MNAPYSRAVRRVLVIEGLCNLAVLLAKAGVGVLTGSLALVSDALHSLADLANNVIAFLIAGMSSAPPDREHPYGHQKYETLAVFGLAVLLSVLAVEIGMRALSPHTEDIVGNPVGLAVMLGVLVVNVIVTVWERRWARRLDSEILAADATHTLSDVLVTTGVIVGWQLGARGYIWLDRLFAIGVAVVVLGLAYGLFKRAVPVLVDHIAHPPEDIAEALRPLQGVLEVRRVRSRWAGTKPQADIVISVPGELSTRDAHDVADAIEAVLREKFAIQDATVHIEPAPEGAKEEAP